MRRLWKWKTARQRHARTDGFSSQSPVLYQLSICRATSIRKYIIPLFQCDHRKLLSAESRFKEKNRTSRIAVWAGGLGSRYGCFLRTGCGPKIIAFPKIQNDRLLRLQIVSAATRTERASAAVGACAWHQLRSLLIARRFERLDEKPPRSCPVHTVREAFPVLCLYRVNRSDGRNVQ